MPNAAALSANALKQQELKQLNTIDFLRILTQNDEDGETDGHWTNEVAQMYLYFVQL